MPMAAGRRMITLRRGGRCAGCGSGLDSGTRAWWDPDARSTTCTACLPPDGPLSSILPIAVAATTGDDALARERPAREERDRRAPNRLGGLILAFSEDHLPHRRSGDDGRTPRLDGLAQDGVAVLRDRCVPGTRTTVDHLAIGPSGVFVIDAQHFSGRIARRDVGGWFRRDVRVFVGHRDCSTMVTSAARQAELVRAALATQPAARGVPVLPVLCFVGAESGRADRSIVVGDVHVACDRRTYQLVGRRGALAPDAVAAVEAAAAVALPSAGTSGH